MKNQNIPKGYNGVYVKEPIYGKTLIAVTKEIDLFPKEEKQKQKGEQK